MNRVLLFIIFSCTQLVYGQELITVNGRVLDATSHQPIVGATVFVGSSAVTEDTGVPGQIQQSALGTLTDSKGTFELKVPKNAAYFTISYVGYESQPVKVSEGEKTIYLKVDNQSLEEVIVTGYTDIKKRKNTTAYDKIKLDDIKQVGVSSIDQLLEGKVAGLQLSNLNGGPNSAPQIRIRGTVSMNGTQDPLWVIDGLPIEGAVMPNTFDKDNLNNLTNLPIAGINPDDIADITVLKDAAATSIYGARAANGVIVITTKRGKRGPAQVQISANTFVTQRPDYGKLNLMNSAEKIDFELALASRSDLDYRLGNGAISRLLTASNEWDVYRNGGLSALSNATQQSINNLRGQSTDWGRELFRNALNQQYTASVSGGNESHTYYISGGYYDEKATTKGVDMRRYSLTFSNDFQINSKLKGGLSLLGSATDRHNLIQDRDGFSNPSRYARNANPYMNVRDAAGNYVYDPDIEGFEQTRYVDFNVVEERENTSYSLANKSLKAIANLQYQIIPSLAIRTELGLQLEEIGTEKFGDKDSYYTRKFREGTRYYDSSSKQYKYFLPDGGIIENSKNSGFQYNWKSFVQYTKSFGERHELEVMAGTELRRSDNTIIETKGFGYDPVTLTNQSIIFPNSSYQKLALYRQYAKRIGATSYASFYANASYTLDRKYNFSGSIRYDGSNMFGVDPKYRFLPIWSLSGSWNASEEEFVRDMEWISNLKIRGSYGIQGNIDRNTYPFIIGEYGNTTLLPGNNEPTINVGAPANDKLRWEKTKSWNAGIDFSLWKNRLSFTVDYYNRTSTDLIGNNNLPQENGFEQVLRNWSSVRNDGVELTISSRNIVKEHFTWSTDFNIAHNRNKLLKVIANPNAYMPDGRAGYGINSLFVLETAGLDADGVLQFRGDNAEVIKFEDFYEVYDPYADFMPGYFLATNLTHESYRNKYKYKGSLDPKFVGGLTNRFKYRNFDLAVSAIFNIDKWVKREPLYNPAKVDRGINYSKEIFQALEGGGLPSIGSTSMDLNDRWMAYSWMMDGDPAGSFRNLDIWAKEMSYFRISSIRLGYTLPKSISNKLRSSNLRVSVEGRNLLVFGTDYTGYFDPETYGNNYAQPISKSIAFGLSATF
ncbi:SusC/RagA family TonB-linked outer membrane protein [Sphingobacterium sp. SYP-B4668]|uniref:SusC/RagA family TonB-linked outer membrane protein n=1 Tax=Sphingobacterium sp. SYP-B4668 TaxID=2996035 RepID=UPI0022DE2E8B|nr:SusC/RagA family TonB-linked outer membrane protein [Sphingobacterium sp. SYP-B4668]